MGNLKIVDEKIYTSVLNEVGKSKYQVFGKDESLPGDISRDYLMTTDFTSVVACSGSLTVDFKLGLHSQNGLSVVDVVIPQNSQVVLFRTLRYCEHDGNPHYNSDDVIFFPDSRGNIIRLYRKDAPDHYYGLSNASGIVTIADAYHLPNNSNGPISLYSENGASLYIQAITK